VKGRLGLAGWILRRRKGEGGLNKGGQGGGESWVDTKWGWLGGLVLRRYSRANKKKSSSSSTLPPLDHC
jgi:hypothetical protein